MLGERYFATRERLSAVIRGITSLAGSTGAEISEKLQPDDIENGLHPPFVFLVCGEVNAGKSSLLNALFSTDLCKVSNLPETKKVVHYQYGPVSRDIEQTPISEIRQRPIGFLRNFHLIDTPGTNSTVSGHQDITGQFFPSAELILFVFPVTNPWGAATWDFISKLPKRSAHRIALIIHQSDQREPVDIEVILGHMRDLSMKRIGYVPEIFAVSAAVAAEARTTRPASAALLRKSGFPALETFISRSICESPVRRRALETWRGIAMSALQIIEDRIEDQSRTLKLQDRFLDQVENEIDAMRERFVNRLSQHLSGVAEVFQTEAVWVSKKLGQRLGAARSILRLFFGDRTGQQMEALFIARLQAAIESVAEIDGTEVVDTCRGHWNDLGERVQTAIGVDLGGPGAIDEILASARQRFVERLGRIAGQGIGQLKVRNQLDKVLRRRNVALKSFTFVTLLMITAGATCGALAIPIAPLVLCGIAGLFLGGGIITAWQTRKRIVADFQQRLLDTCDGFASTLRSDYEEALRIVFQDYGGSLEAVRKHIAGEKLALEPKSRRWQELFLTLKAIEQDL